MQKSIILIIFRTFQLKNFQQKFQHDLGPATRAVDQAIERVQANIQWFEDNYEVIHEWLERATSSENMIES